MWQTEPDFRGSGVSRRTWDLGVIERAAAGDEFTQAYVDGHAHLPDHPGLNVFTGKPPRTGSALAAGLCIAWWSPTGSTRRFTPALASASTSSSLSSG